MGVLQFPTPIPMTNGNYPNFKYAVFSDDLATITTPGYLNASSIEAGMPLSNADVIQVLYSFNINTQTGAFGIFTVNLATSNGQITLTEWSVGGSGTVTAGTTDQIGQYPANGTTISGANLVAGANVTITNVPGSITIAASSGSGTINAGTAPQLAYYAANGTTLSGLATAVPVPQGGTGNVSMAAWAPVVGGTTNTGALQSVSSGGATPGQFLQFNGAALPIWATAVATENWVDQTTASVTMAVNTGYTSDAGASLVTFTLPAVSAIGDWVEINGKGSGKWLVAQTAGQQIQISPMFTTIGNGGSLGARDQYDCVRLRCIVPNLMWTVVSQQSDGLTII